MKNISFLLLMTYTILGCKIESKILPPNILAEPFKECDSLSKKAKLDFKKGTRDYTIMGTVYFTEFESYYSKFMIKNYNVRMKASCEVGVKQECYDTTLNSLLKNEYGENFIELSRKEAKADFLKQKN